MGMDIRGRMVGIWSHVVGYSGICCWDLGPCGWIFGAVWLGSGAMRLDIQGHVVEIQSHVVEYPGICGWDPGPCGWIFGAMWLGSGAVWLGPGTVWFYIRGCVVIQQRNPT